MRDSLKLSIGTLLMLLTAFWMDVHASAPAPQQSITVKGQVVDATNLGLPGVNVVVKGTTNGTITDFDGNYSLPVNDAKATLVLSYMGFLSQEIKVNNQTLINVVLKEDSKTLDEVVVVGYGTVRKGDLTGAISSLKPSDNDVGKVLSIDNLLQGKIAGLSVGGTVATPGAASSITIRGANSLRGDNQPLYIVDNVPQASAGEFAGSAFGGSDFQIAQNPLTSLNPQDIESIEVLKDASATAIYGSRGANGVIIVTTKKGKSGKPTVKANVNFTIANATRLHDMLNLNDFASYRNEAVGDASKQFYPEGGEMRYIFSNGVYDPNNPDSYRVIDYRNWQDEVYRSALSQNYGVNLSGGSEGVRYYISGGYKDIQGIIEKTGLQQGDLRINLTSDISKTVKLNITASGSLKKNNMMSGGDTRGGATGSIARTAIDSSPFLTPSDDPLISTSPEARTTVWSWINDYDDITNENNFKVSGDLTWKICKLLTYNLRAGGNMTDQERARWFGLELFRGQNDNGSLGLTNLRNSNFNVENLLNYNQKFGKILDLGATVGVTYDDYSSINKITNAKEFEFFNLRTKGLHLASIINEMQPLQKDYQLLSYLARVNMSFLEGRYLLTGTIRADGTSKFKSDNRWAYFPSFSAAWRMEQEQFMKEITWIDQIKIRFGYGQTGNQAISPYNSFYDYEKIIDYANASGDRLLALGVSKLQNSGLKWESTLSYNGGVDFSFFNSRLSGSVDVYYKKTKDLLIDREIAPSTGFNAITINQGSLSNKGVELSLSGDIIRTKDVTWSLSGNIAFNTPKIIELGLPEREYGNETYRAYLGSSIGDHFGGAANIFIAGEAPGLFWGYRTDGVIQESDKDLPTSSTFSMTPGNIKVVDVTGDGKIDENDKTILGNPNARFNYGFQTSVSYKGISLSAAFNGVYGNEILNGNIRYEGMPSRQTSNLTNEAYQNAWRSESPSNLYPSVLSELKNVVYDRYIEDGSFLRCTDITLGYTLPRIWTNKIGFGNIDIFASGKNLFVLTKYSGYDPEVNTFAFDGLRPGIDLNSFPNPRQFVFGLNVSF